MSATRTQVYLSEEQRRRIDVVAEAEGLTMAEVIRRAVDEYLDHDVDTDGALLATFGSMPTATAPSRDVWSRG